MSDSIRNLAKAIMWGSIASGGLWLLVTVPAGLIAMADGEILGGLMLIPAPLLLAAACIIPASLIIGLPFTLLLHHIGAETTERYAVAGLAVGIALPIAWSQATFGEAWAGLFLATFGAVGGVVSAISWGLWRETRIAEKEEQAEEGGKQEPLRPRRLPEKFLH